MKPTTTQPAPPLFVPFRCRRGVWMIRDVAANAFVPGVSFARKRQAEMEARRLTDSGRRALEESR